MRTYAEKLKDPRWQRKRLEVFERAKFKCEDCGRSDKTLHAHHCFYVSRRNPWEYNLGLICVCESCHTARQATEQDVYMHLALRMRFMSPEELQEYRNKIVAEISDELDAKGVKP